MSHKSLHPIVLTILDGWGYSEKIKGNAIRLANTPTINKLWDNYPHTLLSASGIDVGLPTNQMGNSEVGHTTIGAGRTIDQDLVRISKSIEDNSFFCNPILHNICKSIDNRKSKLHLIGLCSNGGVHSHINHLLALIKFTKQYNFEICLHLITDGRDTQPNTAKVFIKEIINSIYKIKNVNICTISGRYYSMDRDCRWSRTEKAYKLLTENKINTIRDPLEVIDQYYQQNISDEFITPTRICEGIISNNDGIIFFNFRPDRFRQLLHSFAKKNFKGFTIKNIKDLEVVTFTQYDSNLPINTVFSRQKRTDFLGEIISNNQLKQLRLAETEKYAHVTYFFNGGIEEPFPGEDRELISSPQVDTYDLAPEMSSEKLTESIINAIDKNIYQFIVINYANPDMVGHTGNLEATIKAIEIVDQCLTKLLTKINQMNGTLIVTADHGNAEYMLNDENKPCKSHSTNLVPFILAGNEVSINYSLEASGCLSDIAPTILDLFHLKIPKEMSGKSLLKKSSIAY
uniref:2,3-bisphosphoglycerate-independent phosphoglycerate mutase n=1 Tax=Grateloupia turuturu TaxID=118375 RepID=A0A6B9PHE7_9FLOR|nr:2,3-bisphosphoglycerate-independent phosphoglycerate mutase [Grateloupia turuturu]QHD45191.1 2,3-bisphosphoglycerate-independent phosphoglycerate mutase [Grateloupia turuturu]UXC96735.1 2,3-bisphosphoglycerate-independent phosphoglycerate mutase [Grateloupia turuturu]